MSVSHKKKEQSHYEGAYTTEGSRSITRRCNPFCIHTCKSSRLGLFIAPERGSHDRRAWYNLKIHDLDDRDIGVRHMTVPETAAKSRSASD